MTPNEVIETLAKKIKECQQKPPQAWHFQLNLIKYRRFNINARNERHPRSSWSEF
jgi:hypothetical protein